EKNVAKWLDSIKPDAAELYLLGDIFDFWFEYASVVPKGYIRFLGKLAELADLGVKITLFKGNHDMWMFGYFVDELGARIVDNELILNLDGKKFCRHHGDGLGQGDASYKILKKIFRSPLCQWLFARLHPNLGIGIARRWSRHSRAAGNTEERFLGEDKEWLIQYAKKILTQEHYDYFIFGHRHLPYDIQLSEGTRIINLGEWMNYNSYAVWDGEELRIMNWELIIN
ncbi:MAG TPA: UDP-2,3-diacylglucosamine diphosphatase, partial [Sphingobacterium sp.]|nr:UDP-2,3-diacylglucosamine diphosphatase [Sphingobacterium sp.]